MMTVYDYFLQNDQTKSVRRYPQGSQAGERWNPAKWVWTGECADRRSCELTKDLSLTEKQAMELIKP